MITIANRKQTNKGEYVGRQMGSWCPGSVLGNPFYVHKEGRETAIAKYEQWLRDQWKAGGKVKEELTRLATLYAQNQKLQLLCWCAPEPCHAEVIRKAILGIFNRSMKTLIGGRSKAV